MRTLPSEEIKPASVQIVLSLVRPHPETVGSEIEVIEAAPQELPTYAWTNRGVPDSALHD
jgi:hypothetical protein